MGQAANPGPWTMQIQNIVSASKHLDEYQSQHDCTVWTETCANKFTQERVHRHARKCQAAVTFSAPAPLRRNNTGKGGRAEAVGSLIFAKTPTQPFTDTWDAAVFSSARVTDALLHLQGQQIRVIAVYGFHSGLSDHVPHNDRLLSHVFARASDFHVPTIIAGDLNCELSALPVWTKAQAAGYVDLACRQAAIQSTEPDMTFRGNSRLDYIVGNHSAARAFRSLSVDPKGFTDHAVITAGFDWGLVQQKPPIWHMPFDIGKCQALLQPVKATPPQSAHAQSFRDAAQAGSVDHAAQIFSSAFEQKAQRVHASLLRQPLKQAFLGRLQGKIFQREPQKLVVSQATRQVSDRVRIQQRLKVLDLIRELLRLLQRDPLAVRRQQLWLHILKSKGFSPDFASWLMDNDIVSSVPLSVPEVAWLEDVVHQLSVHAKHWDNVRQQQRERSVSAVFAQDWNKGGKLHAQILKDPSPATLDGLLRKTELQLRLRRACKTAAAVFTVENPALVKVGATWNFGKCQATVVSVRGSAVTIDRPAAAQMTRRTVAQTAWSTDTDYVASQVQSFWNSFWNAPQKLDHEVVSALLQSTPDIPCFDATVSTQECCWLLKASTRTKREVWMDGVTLNSKCFI